MILSVVMSVYNGGKFLEEAVLSVLNQTFTGFEFIIIDDGSIDNSKKIIESFKDARIKLISRENKGLIYSLNEGIAQAKGKYIARMDADDICLPQRFEKQLKFLTDNQDVVLLGTFAKFIDENGKETGEYKVPINYRDIRKEIFWHNPFVHSSVIFERSIFNKAGAYDAKYKHAEDFELWSRMVPKFKSANLPEFLLKYRMLESGVTKSKNLKMRLQGLRIRLLIIKRLLSSMW